MAGGMEFVNGLKDGYNFVDSIYERNDRRERRRERESQDDETFNLRKRQLGDSIQHGEGREQRAVEAHQQNILGNKTRQDLIKQRQNESEFNLSARKKRAYNQETQNKLNSIQVKLNGGIELSKEDLRDMESANINFNQMLSPKFLEDIKKISMGIAESPRNINSPELIEAINRVAGAQVKKGVGESTKEGGSILDKKIVRFIPGRKAGHFSVVLGVKTDKGNYIAPATQNRSSDEGKDQTVLQVPMEDVLNDLMARGTLAQYFQQSKITPLIQSAIAKHGVSTIANPNHQAISDRQERRLDAQVLRDARNHYAKTYSALLKAHNANILTSSEPFDEAKALAQAHKTVLEVYGQEVASKIGSASALNQSSDKNKKASTKEEVDKFFENM